MRVFLFLFLIFPTLSFSQTIQDQTGYGYYSDSDGNVVAKFVRTPGNYPMYLGATTFTNVSNQTSLDSIILSETPEQKTQTLIQQDIQALAIADLQNQGILSSGDASTAMSKLSNLQTAQNTAQMAKSQGVKAQ